MLLSSRRLLEVRRDRLVHELRERGFVDLVALVDVDRAADLALQARVEQALGIRERCAPGERQLHGTLVGLTRAEDAVMRPDRDAGRARLGPLPLFDDTGIRFQDDAPHALE